MDTNDIERVYDLLSSKVKNDLDEQVTKGRLKGTDYATSLSTLLGAVINACIQAPKIDADKETSLASAEVNKEHAKLLIRQTAGFDDNVNMELFKSQMNTWGVMFSSGMLTDKPDIIANDEVTSLYQNVKKG